MHPTHYVKLIPISDDNIPRPVPYFFASNFLVPARQTSEARFLYRVCLPSDTFGNGHGICTSDIEAVYTAAKAIDLFPELVL